MAEKTEDALGGIAAPKAEEAKSAAKTYETLLKRLMKRATCRHRRVLSAELGTAPACALLTPMGPRNA